MRVVGGTLLRNRVAMLVMAWQMKWWRQQTEPLPVWLSAVVDQELQSLWFQAIGDKFEDEWLDWRFEWPLYQSQLSVANTGMYVPSGWGGMGWGVPMPPVGGGLGGPMPPGWDQGAPPAPPAGGGQSGGFPAGQGGQGSQGGGAQQGPGGGRGAPAQRGARGGG